MRLLELRENVNDEFETNIDKRSTSDTRRPRMTLAHLNKLRKIREMKKSDTEKRMKLVGVIYKRPAQ